MTTAADLTAAVDAAAAAADGGRGGDAVARLQELAGMTVTTSLLMATSAGKRVRKLAKSGDPAVAAAADGVVAAWKAAVSAGQAATAAATGAKRAAGSPPPPADAPKKAKQEGAAKADTAPAPAPAAAAAAAAPATAARAAPSTGDPARDRAVAALAAALALVPDAQRDDADPTSVAAAVEAAAAAAHGAGAGGAAAARYKAKIRSLLFNLTDAANPGLRRAVLHGEWDPADLVTAKPEALASDARRAQNAAIREAALFEAERGQNLKKATTDQFQCGKCRQRKCTYFQMQTRSADEPMTTFVTCVACGNRWKFC